MGWGDGVGRELKVDMQDEMIPPTSPRILDVVLHPHISRKRGTLKEMGLRSVHHFFLIH